MAAITISRRLGSGGGSIGRALAARLGFRVVDRELIGAAAGRLGVNTSMASSVDEKSFDYLGELIRNLLHAIQGPVLTQESYHYVASGLVKEAAALGDVVIIGRAGQIVLAGRPDVFHVHVVAPMEDRITELAKRDGVSPEEARNRLLQSDSTRQQYVWTVGHAQWEDPLLYDLVLNTHRISMDDAADIIVDAARRAGVIGKRSRTDRPRVS